MPCIEAFMSNGIVFDVSAAAVLFLSLLLVIDPMRLQEVSFSPFCVQTGTVHKNSKTLAATPFFLHARNISLYVFF